MSAAARSHDTLLPRSPGGHGAGAALSLLAHAGLLLALTTAVDWRTRTPDAVSAELWASVPQAAAPRTEPVPAPPPEPAPTPAPRPAPPPTPVPRAEPPAAEPDIAIERERQRKAEADARRAAEAEAKKAAEAERRKLELEHRQAEALARKKAEEDERRAAAEKQRREQEAKKAEEARLARQREENLKRIMGQAGGATGSGGSGTAARSAGPSAAYAGRLVAEIRRHIFFDTATLPDSAVPEVEVRTAPGGTILSRRLVKSSGHKEWDEAVLRAIDRIATLPRDVDGRVPPVILVAFRPRDS
ncbi:MAG TPA: cell envelope integrity protein TolA [Rubrivivax sp.]|nr:cell envelope integrity protein TolA [Rubrivivax sp.]